MPILKYPDEPRHKRSLAVITCQNRQCSAGLDDKEPAPELADSALLTLLIARIQPHGSQAQRIHEQAVRPARFCCKELFPGNRIAFEASASEVPIKGVQSIQVSWPSCARLRGKQAEGSLQMLFEGGSIEANPRLLETTKMKVQRDRGGVGTRLRHRHRFLHAGEQPWSSLRNEDEHFDAGRRQLFCFGDRCRVNAATQRCDFSSGKPAHFLHGVLLSQVSADRLTLMSGQRLRQCCRRCRGIGIRCYHDVRVLMFQARKPRSQLIETLPTGPGQDCSPWLEQIGFGKPSTIPLCLGPD